jgi:hypothetical protein
MRISGTFTKGLVLALVFTLVPSVAISAQKIVPGTSCPSLGITALDGAKKYFCVLRKDSLLWNKGVNWVAPTPTPTPTPTPSPTPTSVLTNSSNYLDISSCKLGVGTNRIGVGFSQNQYRVRNTKPIRALIFPIDFPDLVATSDPKTDFASITAGVSEYYKNLSEGRSIIEWTIFPSYVRYATKVADANLGGRTTNGYGLFKSQSENLARQNLDLSAFDLVVYAPPLTTTREQIAINPAFIADSPADINSTMLDGQSYAQRFQFLTLTHELGHLMGLADLYNYNAANESAASGSQNTFELQFRYMGIFDLMNWATGPGVELTSWNRWLIDLITDDQIRCLPNLSTTTLLTPVEVIGGIKGAVIPLSPNEAIVIESRRALRYDNEIGKSSEGALIYKVNTSIGTGPMKVVSRPGSNDIWHRDAPLKVNETYTVDGYSISVIESGTFGDVIKVTKN